MRMWMLSPRLLCNKHLLGQHVELHMLNGCLVRKKSLDGYINKHIIEPQSIQKYHNKIVDEMELRNFNHKTPIGKSVTDLYCKVDLLESMFELLHRCENCKARIDKFLI